MLPQRKRLPHDVPSWVPDGERYFITINCRQRCVNTLCRPTCSLRLFDSIRAYEARSRWYMAALVLMPDHLHLIASFPRSPGITATIRAWKGFQAKHADVDWQSGFFEHRLRSDREFSEKVQYVLMNPVRRGLAQSWREWPYVFVRGDW
jgi:putative transposase